MNLLHLALTSSSFGARSLEVVKALTDIAATIRHLGHSDDSLILLDRALDISNEVAGPEHPRTQVILTIIGNDLIDLSDYDRAAHVFERLLLMGERTYGPDHPNVMKTAIGLSTVYCEQRRLPEARGLLERIIRVRRAALGPEHTLVAMPYIELADVARLEGEPTKRSHTSSGLEKSIARSPIPRSNTSILPTARRPRCCSRSDACRRPAPPSSGRPRLTRRR